MLSSGVDFATVIAGFQSLGTGALGTNGTKSKSVPNATSATGYSSSESSTKSSAKSSGSYAEVAKALAFTAKPCSSGEVVSAGPVLGERLSDDLESLGEFGNFNDPDGPKLVSVTQCLLNKPNASGAFGRSAPTDMDLVAFAKANPNSSGNPAIPANSGPQGYIARTQPLMTNKFTGRPLRCIHCGRWQHKAGSAYWIGACSICHEAKKGKDVCTVLAVDWLGERGYV